MRWNVAFGFLLAAVAPGIARAQTVYSDGLNHDVSGPSQAVELQNDGTSLTVLPGALVTGSAAFQRGVAVTGGAGTAINLFGGSIQGASNSAGLVTSGSLAAFGGTVTGGSGLKMYGAGAGLVVGGGGTAVIGGGAFLGGTGGGPGSFFAAGSAQILGGTFRGGDASNMGIVGGAGLTSGGSDLSISGGIFEGGGHGLVSGGGGFALGFNLGNLTISGGTFQAGASSSGFFTNNAAVDATMGPRDLITITGGVFDAAGGASDDPDALYLTGSGFAKSNISGGVFSGSIELVMIEVASTTFIGSSLLYDPGTGFLTGTLEDGSAIDNYIRLDVPTPFYYGHAVDGSETLTFGPLSTPEPSSVVMLLLGVIAVVILSVRGRLRYGASSPKVAGV